MSDMSTVPHDAECLLRIIETAQQVQSRAQFFVWSQGDLQRWLPHKLLVCGAFDLADRCMSFDIFNSIPITDALAKDINQSKSLLLAWAQQQWQGHKRQPFLLPMATAPQSDATVRWNEAGFSEWLVHGVSRPGRPDDIESMFILANPNKMTNADTVQAMGWLMPHIHITWQRVFAHQREQSGSANDAHRPHVRGEQITRREVEMLFWVREGMNNQQIAEQLGISALTVKNHIQKILRKLGASNRTQAVALAMNQQLLPASLAGLTVQVRK